MECYLQYNLICERKDIKLYIETYTYIYEVFCMYLYILFNVIKESPEENTPN